MRPEIPDNLNALTATALKELNVAIRTYAFSKLSDPELSAEDRADIATLMAMRPEIQALADAKVADEAAAAALQAEIDAEAAAVGADAAVEEAEVVPASEVEVVEAAPALALATTVGVAPAITEVAHPNALSQLIAAPGLAGKDAGTAFTSWGELASHIFDTGSTMTGGTRKTEVAKWKADYGNRSIDDLIRAQNRMERDEILAAACAPATPYYDLACQNSLARPVFASLPQFPGVQRGKVSVPSSPTLTDITGQTNPGYGQWTFAMDDDVNAVKNCAVVSCNSFTEYEMYAVWRCITIKNMMQMTYPELVEAYLNRLGAAWARLAETLLLNAMATGTTKINAKALGYGGTTTLTTTLLEYLALYQETQRWDLSDNMEVWTHRWVLTAVKMDLMRRRRVDGSVPNVPSDAQVNAIFANAGFNMHWAMDVPTWMVPISSVATGGNLNTLPATAQFLIAPRGKFALIDRGELSIGVNGNNLYRDNASNARNQFTLFYESFEGVVNTMSCPAHIVDIPLCWNGIQVDDQLVNCAGQNMPGFQS